MEVELKNKTDSIIPPVRRPKVAKYDSEEERVRMYKKQQNNYAKKKFHCESCKRDYSLGNKWSHLKTLKHANNL